MQQLKSKINTTPDYEYRFESSKPREEIFEALLDVGSWWSGLYQERIEGSSSRLNDEFTFSAGDGAHYSKQKLIELVSSKKIVWLITDSNLNFLRKPDEWTDTKIRFDISSEQPAKTKIAFTHEGLVSEIECYHACAGAWTGYLNKLAKKLK